MCLTGSATISIHEEQLQISEPGRKSTLAGTVIDLVQRELMLRNTVLLLLLLRKGIDTFSKSETLLINRK